MSKRIKDLIDGVYDAEGAAAELKDMIGHARNLEFEKAAKLRDQLAELKKRLFGVALQSQ